MRTPTTDLADEDPNARDVLAMLADQWTMLVVYSIGDDVRRYSEVQRMIPDISAKMLTQTLRKLERNGMVERTAYPVVPPRTEYQLTPLGSSLLGPLHELCVWVRSHSAEVAAAREGFERRYSTTR